MEEELRDLRLRCVDCGNEFIFEVGEQKYYKLKEYFTPKRCPFCRKAKRIAYGKEGIK